MSYTNFKEVTTGSAGTAAKYGGADIREVMQIFNNKIVSGRRISIKNPFIWTDSFDMSPPLSAPASPTDSNASRIYVDPSDFKIKIKKVGGTVLDIENVNIPDTALSQITTKAKLPTSGVYNDQNNSMGAFYMEFSNLSTPSNPTSGKRRMYVDSATGELSVRTSAGTTLSLETAVGGGGGGDVFLNQTNTFGDFDNKFRSGRLLVRNPANTFSYTITGSAIVADRAVILPLLTAGDTLLCEANTAAITNKTIVATSNTISAIGDANIASHTTTKITTTAKGQLNSAIAYNDQANTFGLFDQTFKSSRLIQRNPADTFSYIFAGSAIVANRTITWPLLTADDTAVTQAFSQPITNKTVNIDQNTLKHSTTNAAGDILTNNATQFGRLARGTALQVLRVNSGGTDIQWASLDSERIGKATASGNGATTVFNIAHGIGSNPTYALISIAQAGSANPQPSRTYTTDATNIIVTFQTAPTSGTNNITIYWIAVA